MKLYRKGIVFLTLVILLGMTTISSMGNYIENDSKINFGKILESDINPSSSFASRTNEVGRYSSLELDSNGYPHISYCDTGNGDLKYASWTGSSWNIETVDSAGDVGYTTSLALDSNENPHISYFDYSNIDLRYASWTGSNWDIETVDSTGDVGAFTSLELDNNGYPHISYYDISNTDLKYVSWTGGSWNIETVDSDGAVGGFTSLALDANENPHISYFDYGNEKLKYAGWTGSSWNIETIGYGTQPSIIIDGNGYPHISYFDNLAYCLGYARWTGSSWNKEKVDDQPGDKTNGRQSSIDFDTREYPCISYWDMDNGDLKYASWTGGNWDIEVVDSEGCVGYDTSLVIDSNSNPYISYFDFGKGNLKYASMNIGGWDIQTVDSAECMDLLDQKNIQWCGWSYSVYGDITAFAQSFIPSIESLIRVELPINKVGDPIGIKISIRDDLDGDDLASDYITGNEVNEQETFWYGFDFPELTLNIGQEYYIIWEPEGESEGNDFYWCFSYNDQYIDGSAWVYEDSYWDDWNPGSWDDFDFLFRTFGSNDPPNTPTIDGPEEGKAGEEQEYIINTTDPDGDDVYYCINWGNASEDIWDGPCESGKEITMSHTWVEEGIYTITVKAKDEYDFESDYVSLEVNMPKTKSTNSPFLTFLENHPHLFPLLRHILRL